MTIQDKRIKKLLGRIMTADDANPEDLEEFGAAVSSLPVVVEAWDRMKANGLTAEDLAAGLPPMLKEAEQELVRLFPSPKEQIAAAVAVQAWFRRLVELSQDEVSTKAPTH